MAVFKEQFEIPSKLKTWSLGLIIAGLIAFVAGFITHSGSQNDKDIFWATVMYNSIFFTMICNASMFFICATTLAMGGWQVVLRRVPEAISTLVPVFGVIAFVVLMYVVLGMGSHTEIYEWLHKDKVNADDILKGKSGFLNPVFFVVWTTLTIGLWSLLGWRMRVLSNEADQRAFDADGTQDYIWRNTVSASLFIIWFALTVASTVPWLWLMSIDAHWYSTMYSWYTFASSFVSGMSLIALWVIYLKNKGYLEYVNEEHLHDLGKFMFAFSIFWTYLWFSQYMLQWYANIPEETVYFKHRVQGAYSGIFYLNLILNFVCPIIILMKRGAKRNYTLMTFMAVLILFGHWIDFYQMVMGSVSKNHVTLGWLDFGIAMLFIGLMIWFTAKALAKKPLYPKFHPFFKESIIHHT